MDVKLLFLLSITLLGNKNSLTQASTTNSEEDVTASPTDGESVTASSTAEEYVTASPTAGESVTASPTAGESVTASPTAGESVTASPTAGESAPASTVSTGATVSPTETTAVESDSNSSTSFSTSSSTSFDTNSSTSSNTSSTTLTPCRPKLNLNENLSPFWVLTVLQSVPSSTDISGCQWTDAMESLLLTLLTESRALSSSSAGRRRRRYAENSSLQLQLVRATRAASSERVSLVYYAMSSSGAAYLPASSVVSAINGNSARASVVLGYSVGTPAASIYDSESAASSSKLWVIGAVLGCLGALLLIVWAVLFTYHKCLRPYEAPKYLQQQPGLAFGDEDFLDYEGEGKPTGAFGSAKPGRPYGAAGISGADMDELADRVAERLDRQVTRILRDSSRRQRDEEDADEEHSGDEENEAGDAGQSEATRRGAARKQDATHELPGKRIPDAGSDEEDIVVDAEVIAPRRHHGVSSASAADRSPPPPADKSSRAHEAAERKRNKKRLQRKVAADKQARVGPSTYDRVDGAGRDAGSGAINEGLEFDPDLLLPVPNSPDPSSTVPQLCAPTATARSPYATGDAVARIMPYLETDREKHFNLNERDLLAQAELHHRQLTQQQQQDEAVPEQPGSGRTVLIAVEPRTPNPNSDEWDLIRDSAAEDPRVSMLTALRREARAMGFGNDTSMV